MRRFMLLIIMLWSSLLAAEKVDIIVFSFDRPMQLFACLESIEKYFSGANQIQVIYRTSNQEYDDAYTVVWNRFPYVKAYRQGLDPKEDFQPLVLTALFTSPCPYIMFAVDDIIVTDYVNVSQCVDAMEAYKAWGFFLRLGKNITNSYSRNKETPVPVGKDLTGNLFLWQFPKKVSNWGYPNSLDMTLYRKKSLLLFFENEDIPNPNRFEATWDRKYKSYKKKGLCFTHSKIVNIPLNMVNTVFRNRHSTTFTPGELLAKFKAGLKIDISQFYKMNNRSPHEEAIPRFISR